MSQALPSLIGVEVMGRVLPPIPITEALAGQTLASALTNFLRPEAAMIWARQEALGVTAGPALRSASPSTRLSDILNEFAGQDQVTISLRAAARGGADGWRIAEPDSPDMPFLEATTEVMDKVVLYGGAVTRQHGAVEFGGLLLGPPDQPGVISDFVLLGDQRVNIGFFEAGEQSVEDALRRALEGRDDLVPRGVIHRHPGYSGYGVFHSSIDDRYIGGKLLPALASEALTSEPWVRPLRAERTADGLRIPLDCFNRLTVVLRLESPPEGPGPVVAEARLEGSDTVAEVHSLVFVADGTCRSWSQAHRFVVAPTREEQPRFFQEVEERVYAVRKSPAAALGVAAAVSPSLAAAEAEVAREIEVGWNRAWSDLMGAPEAAGALVPLSREPAAQTVGGPGPAQEGEGLREQVFDLAWQAKVLTEQLLKSTGRQADARQGEDDLEALRSRIFDLAWQADDLADRLMKLSHPTVGPAEA